MNELDLFAAAIAIADPSLRAALLERECAGRPDVRNRLDQLLAALYGRSGDRTDESSAGTRLAALGCENVREQCAEFTSHSATQCRRRQLLAHLRVHVPTADRGYYEHLQILSAARGSLLTREFFSALAIFASRVHALVVSEKVKEY